MNLLQDKTSFYFELESNNNNVHNKKKSTDKKQFVEETWKTLVASKILPVAESASPRIQKHLKIWVTPQINQRQKQMKLQDYTIVNANKNRTITGSNNSVTFRIQ